MSKIIVGVDESPGSDDAIALASSLAGMTGAQLVLVNVYAYDPHPNRASNPEYERYVRDDSLALLKRLWKVHGENAELMAVPSPSPARGLHEFAADTDAALIVVGSTHTGRAGRVLPGSTAERLLHGSPCPIAVAPKEYANHTPSEPAIVGCGFDGSVAARNALATAHRIAGAQDARLRVIRVFRPLAYDAPPQKGVPMGGITYNDQLRDRAEEELDEAVAALEGEPRGERFFAVGDPGKTLAEASEELDLLVLGSRGYGPLHAVLVGGVAGRVVRDAACPVIVLPRTAGHVEEGSLFAAAAPPVRG
jgi:nucleotide-binding universal stress UspA family protein